MFAGAHREAWACIHADAHPEVQASRTALREARAEYDREKARPGADLKAARKRFALVERAHGRLLRSVKYGRP